MLLLFLNPTLALQECMFNAVACFLYLSASSYMGIAVNFYLYQRYLSISMYAAYPAMTAVYVSNSAYLFC